MRFFILMAALAVAAMAAPSVHMNLHNTHAAEWRSFKAAFGKSYEPAEEAKRFAIFGEKLAFIAAHNARHAAGQETYTVGVNQFSDLTSEEFRTGYLSKYESTRTREFVTLPTGQAPASVDWRTKGAVTPVKNQGQCGSCWSFSTTGSVEGAWAIAGNKLTSASEQQLVDCSKSFGNQGCNGGMMDDAFKYIIKNGGLDTEEDYPYTARDGQCNTAKAAKHAVSINGFADVPTNSDSQLEAAVAIGPVSVAIEADQSGFQSYSGGVFSGPCGTQLDHGVLVVGYTADYWIVKNSWAASWGDQGYIMMKRNVGPSGICGIESSASYPKAGKPGPSPPSPPGPPAPPAPPGPPAPPAPPGPGGQTHYGDPNEGPCMSDEIAVEIQGVPGKVCSPDCSRSSPCPTDYPAGTGAVKPECALEANGKQTPTNCILVCQPFKKGECPPKAACQSIQGMGLCTYMQ